MNIEKAAKKLAKRVAPIYELLNWTWSGEDDENYIPNKRDIYNTLMMLSGDIGEYAQASTGGLMVEKYKDEELGDTVRLSFKISEEVTEGYDTDEL